MYLHSASLQDKVKTQNHYSTFDFITGNLSMSKLDKKELTGAAKNKRFTGSIQGYPDGYTERINITYQKRHKEKSKFGID